nr:Dihydrofolate reductase [uncultured bacterium]
MVIIGPVAIAKNGIIGGDNDLPWYIPEDLKHFKKITLGKTVLMGRKTYESIVARLHKPLPGRKSVVITRDVNFAQRNDVPPEVLVFHDLNSALDALNNEDIYVIGGAQIFTAAMPRAEKMFITHIHEAYDGDVYFPEVDYNQWNKIEEEPHEDFTYAVYAKK